jgi:hypothetical protein
MDKRQSEFFPGSEIRPSIGHRYPVIPMFHAALYDLEEKGKFMYEELELEFGNHDGTF